MDITWRSRAPDGGSRPAGAGPDRGCLAGIPGVLIHGRLDVSGPLDTAWELARTWPDAELVAVRDAGHQGSDTTRERMLRAAASHAVTRPPVASMLRIGPAYIPPEHRAHGYASVVRATVAACTPADGACQVVLFHRPREPGLELDLPAAGVRPVHEAVEFRPVGSP